MLGVMSQLDETSSIGRLMFQIKPWLNLDDSEINESVNQLIKKAESVWDPVSDEMAGELRQAVVAMQHLIGEKGSLLDKLSACSVEMMIQLLSSPNCGLGDLGTAFVELDSKVAEWNKSSASDATHSDVHQKLVEEAHCLSHAAKLILACLNLVKDKKKADVDSFVAKLGKRELTLEALPAALRIAIQDLKKS
eukprot:s1849_g9.t1